MPKEAESPEWSCPKPSGWTPNGPIVACTRGAVDGGEPSLAGLRPTKGYEDYCAGAPGCEGEVPYPLRRALHLPKIDHGEPCPTSPRQQVSAAFAPALGTGPVYPVGFSARAVLTFEYPPPKNSQFAGSAWGGRKVLWVSDPGYEGPILIRGRQLDGPGFLGFGGDEVPLTEMQLPPGYAENFAGGWRNFPSYTRLRAPGCYGYQVDGTTFSEVVVFRALVAREAQG